MEKVQQGQLLKKYDVPVPRYTSYPTVPYWDASTFSKEQWTELMTNSFLKSDNEGLSLYIHLPFCESLCTYCACTTRITKNHNVEIPYIQALLKEWETYRRLFGKKPVIRELHLGGGTPTFFSAQNLQWLITYLLEEAEVHPNHQFSFEGHPNNTTYEHLRMLYGLGFRRVSFGVQDLDEKVQRAINRLQPFENLENVTRQAREVGFESVSFDLVYGLPHQNPFTVSETIDNILKLKPDRVSFYSYAHVPWLRPAQRGYSEIDLPSSALKRHLYEIGRHKLRQNGYEDIGMDHFALRHDELFKAHVEGRLHRNFMGYTTTNTNLLIGLGASAISDAGDAYAQNFKKVEEYISAIKDNGSAIFKGHLLSPEDILVKQAILDIACKGRLEHELYSKLVTPAISEQLKEMEEDGMLYMYDGDLVVTTTGEPFIRNICSLFDKRMNGTAESKVVFSKSI